MFFMLICFYNFKCDYDFMFCVVYFRCLNIGFMFFMIFVFLKEENEFVEFWGIIVFWLICWNDYGYELIGIRNDF